MSLVRNIVDRGGPNPDKSGPGDTVLGGEKLLSAPITTIGATVLDGPSMITGIIVRSGSTAGYADTFDAAANIITAARANSNVDAEVLPGSSFRLLIVNTVAFADTVAVVAGSGTIIGSGVTAIAASTWREFLVTVLNSTLPNIQQCTTVNGNAVLTFVLPPNRSSIAIGPNSSFNPSVGATVSGAGITNGTTVIGLGLGAGGIVSVTMSANATATSASSGVAVTFGPTVQIDGLRSGPL